jgi:hypothetical protein
MLISFRHDYQGFVQTLMASINEVKKSFYSRCKKKEVVNSEQALDVLDDVGIITAFDIEDAKYWFSPQNKSITKKYNLK